MAQKPDLQHRSLRGRALPPIPAENLSASKTIARRHKYIRSSGLGKLNYTLSRDCTDDKKVHAQRLSTLLDRRYGQRGNLRRQSIVGDGGEVESILQQAKLAFVELGLTETDNRVEIETRLKNMTIVKDPARFPIDHMTLAQSCIKTILELNQLIRHFLVLEESNYSGRSAGRFSTPVHAGS